MVQSALLPIIVVCNQCKGMLLRLFPIAGVCNQLVESDPQTFAHCKLYVNSFGGSDRLLPIPVGVCDHRVVLNSFCRYCKVLF